MSVQRESANIYQATLEITNVTMEDGGKYELVAKNALGESNAAMSLNFDSKLIAGHEL